MSEASYTRHNWVAAETVTASKMNNIENGIELASAGGALLISFDYYDESSGKYWYNRTFREVADALRAGTPCYFMLSDNSDYTTFGQISASPVCNADWNPNRNEFSVFAYDYESGVKVGYTADSLDGYLYQQTGTA